MPSLSQVFVDVAEEMLGALNALLFKYGVNCAVHLDFIVSSCAHTQLPLHLGVQDTALPRTLGSGTGTGGFGHV